jgi:hypothetical protein
MLRGPQETPLLRFLGCNLAQRFSAGEGSVSAGELVLYAKLQLGVDRQDNQHSANA